MFAMTISRAQTTAMQINGPDCKGVNHDLFKELDSGKAVVVFFFMDNCGSCPPPAKKVQTMANNIMKKYPGKVTGYAMPFTYNTNCAATANWVSNNSLPLYAPYDSGVIQVAHYGGFGMPTVVLLGGKDHRVMFSTQSFSTSDTGIMRDSILSLFGDPSLKIKRQASFSEATIFPNPVKENMLLQFNVNSSAELQIEIYSMSGNMISGLYNGQVTQGLFTKEIQTESLSNGTYFIRIRSQEYSENRLFVVNH